MSAWINRLISKGTSLQRCPDCDESINSDAVNIKEGVALCPGCGKLSRLSELNYDNRSLQEILAKPPTGCSIVPLGHGAVVSASLRSFGGFLGAACFALFWNGIVSIFVLVAIAGLYTNLIGPLPAWFPAPRMNEGKPQMNGGPMDLGMTLFLCVFLIPFVTIGTGMAAAAIINLVGKVQVVIDDAESYVTTGVGFVKWKRRFHARDVRAVNFGYTAWRSNGASSKLIEMVADRTIKFGSLLATDRLEWLRAVLKEMLLTRDGNRPGLTVPNVS